MFDQDHQNQAGASTAEAEIVYVAGEVLAKRYGLSLSTVRRMGAHGVFPRVSLNSRCVRYPLDECDEVMRAHRAQPLAQG